MRRFTRIFPLRKERNSYQRTDYRIVKLLHLFPLPHLQARQGGPHRDKSLYLPLLFLRRSLEDRLVRAPTECSAHVANVVGARNKTLVSSNLLHGISSTASRTPTLFAVVSVTLSKTHALQYPRYASQIQSERVALHNRSRARRASISQNSHSRRQNSYRKTPQARQCSFSPEVAALIVQGIERNFRDNVLNQRNSCLKRASQYSRSLLIRTSFIRTLA